MAGGIVVDIVVVVGVVVDDADVVGGGAVVASGTVVGVVACVSGVEVMNRRLNDM